MCKKILSMILAILMVASFAVVFASCSSDEEKNVENERPLPAPELTAAFTQKEGFKLGFICLHDENSTYDNNFLNAAKELQRILGLKNDQLIIKTNVPESNACYEAAVECAKDGCDIVFADSFGHEDYMIQAAKQYPQVQFCHATGVKAISENLANYHNAFASIYEGRYLAGIAAGLKLNEMISSGKITADKAKMGYVGAFTYAEVISGLSSFYLGAKSVCPSVTMDVQFTGSWYDQALETEAANALMAQGCVLISQHADSMGAPTACELKGVPNVSYNGSTLSACPDTFLVSSAINWAPYLLYITKCVSTGTAIATNWCGGIKEGSVILSEVNAKAAAEGTVAAIKKAIEGFKNGTLHVFDVNTFTVGGEKLVTFLVNGTEEVVKDGYFHESEYIAAPYFDKTIDGITFLNVNFG